MRENAEVIHTTLELSNFLKRDGKAKFRCLSDEITKHVLRSGSVVKGEQECRTPRVVGQEFDSSSRYRLFIETNETIR